MSACKEPSQPFPSPGSAFIPPPIPGPHEFAVRSASLPRKMSKKDADDALLDGRGSTTCNGATTPTPTTTTTTSTTNGVGLSSSSPTPLTGVDASTPNPSATLPPPIPPRDSPDVQPHHPPHDPAPAFDPSSLKLAHHTPHRLSTQSITSLTSSRPAPPSPAVSRRASGFSRVSSRPTSDMNSNISSRPISGVQHSRPASGGGSRPASGTAQPITPSKIMMTVATTTTSAFSCQSEDRPSNFIPTLPVSEDDLLAAQSTPAPSLATTITTTAPTLIQIRDYGFAFTDPRFTGLGMHVPRANRPAVLARRLAPSSGSRSTSSSGGDSDDDYEDCDNEQGGRMDIDEIQKMWEDMVDDGESGWSGFRWGFGRAWGFDRMSGTAGGLGNGSSSITFPSRGDLDRNFGGENECEEMEMDEANGMLSDEEGEGDAEGEPPLFPGLYRALYAFEPEGTAEMRLDEDQFVRVIGRGGGVGWAVVVKDGLKDTGVHALVPESYLELVRLDGEDA